MNTLFQPEIKEVVGLLITGNEVLFGKTKDTNGPFMAAHFRSLGIAVEQIMICGDNETQLLDCLTYLSAKCTTVIMTGGLGPTSDDLTAQLVAQYLDLPVQFFPEAWEACVQAFGRFGRTDVPESNKKQALLPAGSQLIPNNIGTAVGFIAQGQIKIICLPGVPFELEPMFLNTVLPLFKGADGTFFSKTWQVFYMGESSMQLRLNELEQKTKAGFPDAVISYQAHAGSVTYSLTYPCLPIALQNSFF
jgi:nicotinamide-nucleotide amidase